MTTGKKIPGARYEMPKQHASRKDSTFTDNEVNKVSMIYYRMRQTNRERKSLPAGGHSSKERNRALKNCITMSSYFNFVVVDDVVSVIRYITFSHTTHILRYNCNIIKKTLTKYQTVH